MRQSIFKKAELLKDKVVEQGSLDNKSFYSFEIDNAPLITIICNRKYTYIESCTCQHCSIFHGIAERVKNHSMLCSYKIAVIKALPIPSKIFEKEPREDETIANTILKETQNGD